MPRLIPNNDFKLGLMGWTDIETMRTRSHFGDTLSLLPEID